MRNIRVGIHIQYVLWNFVKKICCTFGYRTRQISTKKWEIFIHIPTTNLFFLKPKIKYFFIKTSQKYNVCVVTADKKTVVFETQNFKFSNFSKSRHTLVPTRCKILSRSASHSNSSEYMYCVPDDVTPAWWPILLSPASTFLVHIFGVQLSYATCPSLLKNRDRVPCIQSNPFLGAACCEASCALLKTRMEVYLRRNDWKKHEHASISLYVLFQLRQWASHTTHATCIFGQSNCFVIRAK
jgi:hypothetical protein